MASYTLAQLQALERAIASGTQTVEVSEGGVTRKVEYRSLADMRKIAEEIRRSLGQSEGGLRLGYFSHSKDLP